MKLPRDLSGLELAQRLRALGYQQTRQTGSHIRLTTTVRGEHHITIPAHDPVKLGTLNRILREIEAHHRMNRQQMLDLLE